MRRNRRDFAEDLFKWIFLDENVLISIEISLKFITKGPINNIPALVDVLAWHRLDGALSEPMMPILTHIFATLPQRVASVNRDIGSDNGLPVRHQAII